MKVKVLKKFRDKNTGEMYDPGQIIEVTKKRHDEILAVDKLIEVIPAAKKKE